MMCKTFVHIVAYVLILSSVFCSRAGVAAVDGVDLRFSLEARPVTVTVSGKVTDATTGEPIADALVRGHIVVWRYRGPDMFERCPYAETRADAQGVYQLRFVTVLTTSGPSKGRDGLCVDASAPGYETRPEYAKQKVTPESTQYSDFDFALGPGQLITGKVVDPDAQPVAQAVVRLQGGLNGDWDFFGSTGQTTTDDDGQFALWISPGRGRWLNIAKGGHGASFFWDYLDKGDMGTLVLARGGSIRGRIVDGGGKGVAGCEVSVRGYPCNLIDKVSTDSEGYYTLRGVPGEPGIIDFYKTKNGTCRDEWGQAEVHARPDPEMDLANAPTYKLLARDGQTIPGPNLVVGTDASVSGRLVASNHTYGLGGLLVRLDSSWNNMVEVDADGGFQFPYVSPGKHRLTAYLPYNLRYDRGIGQATIDVQQGEPLAGVQIELADLAELRAQYLDADGNPLQGITAGATWSPGGEGGWTEGTMSDQDGWAVLYLYPNELQYVQGFDHSGSLVAETFVKIQPRPGEVMSHLRIVMVPPAAFRGRLMSRDAQPLAGRTVLCRLDYADEASRRLRIQTDATGSFEVVKVRPGMVGLVLETLPLQLSAHVAGPVELQPGATADLGDLVLQTVAFYRVSGRLAPSPTFTNLEGLLIRLDLEEWEPMVPTDSQGGFVLPRVPAGRHRLTAYLPFNRRTDRGVGHVEIEVGDGDLNQVELPLDTLATIHVRITDETGSPLQGVAAAAWWTEDHTGVFTEGTKSDKQGRATLYTYAGDRQYVGAHDWENRYSLTGHHEVMPEAGQLVEDLHVIMRRNSDAGP